VVEAGIRRYCTARRARIGKFVDEHFSLRGAVALHRAAVGWDIVRAPINLAMAGPAVGLRLAAAGMQWLGAVRAASILRRQRLLLPTSVAQQVEWLVCTELLELPFQVGARVATRDVLAETILADPRVSDALQERLTSIDSNEEDPLLRQRVEKTLAEYTGARNAAAEITTAFMSLGTGGVTLGKLTPGMVSFGPTLASVVAQQTAISSFPLGAALGTLWYGVFPSAPSPVLTFGVSAGLLIVGTMLAAFAGIVADPVQRLLGVHQRRLRRMIDAMERQMLDPAAKGYAARDPYVARLLDAFDLIATVHRLAR
jgi:hypothetical protein